MCWQSGQANFGRGAETLSSVPFRRLVLAYICGRADFQAVACPDKVTDAKLARLIRYRNGFLFCGRFAPFVFPSGYQYSTVLPLLLRPYLLICVVALGMYPPPSLTQRTLNQVCATETAAPNLPDSMKAFDENLICDDFFFAACKFAAFLTFSPNNFQFAHFADFALSPNTKTLRKLHCKVRGTTRYNRNSH